VAIENARYIFSNMKNIGDEVEFKEDGIIRKRAQHVLDEAIELLGRVKKEGLFSSLEKGIFGDVKRSKTGGKGLQGVVQKSAEYSNPFIGIMKGETTI
jgi:beta-lysine 5,6-aminomutase alpha subunit